MDKSGLFDMSDYDYFCYVTTDESLTPLQTHHKYGERATCETWIDECKNQMKACNIRTEDFFANAALFQCSILAYNIIKWMALLAGGKVRHWEVKTIRLYSVRVAGKLIESARQLTLESFTEIHSKDIVTISPTRRHPFMYSEYVGLIIQLDLFIVSIRDIKSPLFVFPIQAINTGFIEINKSGSLSVKEHLISVFFSYFIKVFLVTLSCKFIKFIQ
ncbi:transposase [Candidatus Magnetobacterium bavaricum]|uniref:Transposase n=1 Tax=Candidatus Magnetobacterium bavaricum TaxID=29290 RepID=A0A0F3GWJ0_9BACT|nr:transposase [Candidatus Magnetobacterium bavaricum]